jgi:hypothetical protein
MSTFAELFLGPLNKSTCLYMYYLSVFFFFTLLLCLCKELFHLLKNYNKVGFKDVTHGFCLFFHIFVAYFITRYMYTLTLYGSRCLHICPSNKPTGSDDFKCV